MGKIQSYIVTYKIKTNYDMEEIIGVIDKVFEIPASQYEDCECFEYKKLLITKIETLKNKGQNGNPAP